MLKNFFKKNKVMTEAKKKDLKLLCIFYEKNRQLFINDVNSQKEKRTIIKKIYSLLNYSEIPILDDNQKRFKNPNEKLYRGISADNEELLNKYIEDLVSGTPYYDGRASIYGTGIYTVIGTDSNIAKKYASNGGTSRCGIVIEATLSDNARIIESSKIDDIRESLLQRLKKIYTNEVDNYLKILQDNGALAAILGYDAIFVKEKNYIVILNRHKMIINSKTLSNNNVNNENYPKR